MFFLTKPKRGFARISGITRCKQTDCRRILQFLKLRLAPLFTSQVEYSPQLLIRREDLPVLDQLLPDDSSHDILAEAAVYLGEVGVGVVEAVQQHLGHLPLLLPYQPEMVSLSFGANKIFVEFVKIFFAFSSPPLFSASPLPRSQEARACH